MLTDCPNYYDDVHIMCYPGGAGGKFLINCLSLSWQCVFADSVLAKAQILDKFDLHDKITFLEKKLQEAKQQEKWTDLNLGCAELLGVESKDYIGYHQIIQYKFDPVVNLLIKNKKKFFLVAHSTQDLENQLLIWPRAKIIFHINYRQFLEQRKGKPIFNKKLVDYWQKIRDDSWPIDPPNNFKDLNLLPSNIIDDVTNKFDLEISRWFDHTELYDGLYHSYVENFYKVNCNSSYVWNVSESYESIEKFLSNFNLLADSLGIHQPPVKYLIWYYKKWQDLIHLIQVSHTSVINTNQRIRYKTQTLNG